MITLMNTNEHTMDGPLRKMLEVEGVDLEEFSNKHQGRKSPNTFLQGEIPIDAGYTAPDIEMTAFCMIPFMHSPEDHRA